MVRLAAPAPRVLQSGISPIATPMTLRPTISLTTDFGIQDPFVGTMKGVIASICPDANVVDITHAIPAFDLLEGALALWQAWRYFPAGAVHVAVVDPGVGSARQPILSRMADHWFIAPDNGLLTLVERDIERDGGAAQHRILQNPRYMLPAQSHTFHGRDIFAPAAAHLAAQIASGAAAPESFGPALANPIRLTVPEPVHHPDGSLEGIILKSDRFGNLLTNVPARDLPTDWTHCTLELGNLRIARFCRFYAEGEPDELFAIVGSSGLLEIAMNRGSASGFAQIKPGAKFQLSRTQT